MFVEDETQKRAQVAPATSSVDTDKSAVPMADQSFSDALFEEKTRQYVQKYLTRWYFPASWHVDIVVVSKEEMPRKEAEMTWDATGILYARLRIRRDIPESLHERLVAHEMLELLSRHEADVIHSMADYIDEPMRTEFLRAYYKAHNESIEHALAAIFGPRKDHLLYDEDPCSAKQPPVFSHPVTPIPEATSPYVTDTISFRELMEQLNHEDDEKDEEEGDDSWLLGDTCEGDEPYSLEHPIVRIDIEGLGEKSAPVEEAVPEPVEEVEEKQESCLLDDMSQEDQEILAHLHALGANQTSSFFAGKTHLVLPVTPLPITDGFVPEKEVRLPSQPLSHSSRMPQQTKSPFSRPRLTPVEEQNAAWTFETVQTPSLSLPVVKKQAKKTAKSAWETFMEQFGLSRKGE